MMMRVLNMTRRGTIIEMARGGHTFSKCLSCLIPLPDNTYMCDQCWINATSTEKADAQEALRTCQRGRQQGKNLAVEVTNSPSGRRFTVVSVN